MTDQISVNEYYAALGEFIHHFTKVENVVHLAFPIVAGISDEKATAIKRQMAAKELITIIKDLLPLSDFPADAQSEILESFQQFAHIATFRNAILHRGADLLQGWLVLTNSATAKSSDSYEEMYFTVHDLHAATNDLLRIRLRLSAALQRVPPEALTRSDPGFFGPWRYKYAPPEKPYQLPQSKSPKQPRPP